MLGCAESIFKLRQFARQQSKKCLFCNQLNIKAIQLRASSSKLSNKERKILRKRKALEKQAATEAKEKLNSTVTWSVNMKDSLAADERLSRTESCKSIKDLKAEIKATCSDLSKKYSPAVSELGWDKFSNELLNNSNVHIHYGKKIESCCSC